MSLTVAAIGCGSTMGSGIDKLKKVVKKKAAVESPRKRDERRMAEWFKTVFEEYGLGAEFEVERVSIADTGLDAQQLDMAEQFIFSVIAKPPYRLAGDVIEWEGKGGKATQSKAFFGTAMPYISFQNTDGVMGAVANAILYEIKELLSFRVVSRLERLQPNFWFSIDSRDAEKKVEYRPEQTIPWSAWVKIPKSASLRMVFYSEAYPEISGICTATLADLIELEDRLSEKAEKMFTLEDEHQVMCDLFGD